MDKLREPPKMFIIPSLDSFLKIKIGNPHGDSKETNFLRFEFAPISISFWVKVQYRDKTSNNELK